jgi:hypothetical protein
MRHTQTQAHIGMQTRREIDTHRSKHAGDTHTETVIHRNGHIEAHRDTHRDIDICRHIQWERERHRHTATHKGRDRHTHTQKVKQTHTLFLR